MKNAISFGALIGLVLVSLVTFNTVLDSKVAISEISAQSQSAATVVSAAIATSSEAWELAIQENGFAGAAQTAILKSTTTAAYNNIVQLLMKNCQLRTALGDKCQLGSNLVSVPNGGEVWTKGTPNVISWKLYNQLFPYPGTAQKVNIDLVGIGNPTFQNIASGLSPTTTFYRWTVPSTVPDGNYRIRVAVCPTNNLYNLNCIDETDGIFSIGGTSTATTTQPIISFLGSDAVKNPGQFSGDPDKVDFSIRFRVQASGGDIYIDGDTIAKALPVGATDGLAWATTTNSTTGTSTYIGVITASNSSSGDFMSATDRRFKVSKAASRDFTFQVSIPAGKDNSAVGVRLTGIKWDTVSRDGMVNLYSSLADFKTNTVNVTIP